MLDVYPGTAYSTHMNTLTYTEFTALYIKRKWGLVPAAQYLQRRGVPVEAAVALLCKQV